MFTHAFLVVILASQISGIVQQCLLNVRRFVELDPLRSPF